MSYSILLYEWKSLKLNITSILEQGKEPWTLEGKVKIGKKSRQVGTYQDVSSSGHKVNCSIKYCLGNSPQMGRICGRIQVCFFWVLKGNPSHTLKLVTLLFKYIKA